MSFLDELRRRNVVRVAMLYVAAAWLVLQVADIVLEVYGVAPGAMRVLMLVLSVGFVVAVVAAWVYELTPSGIVRDDGTSHGAGRGHGNRLINGAIVTLGLLAVGVLIVSEFVVRPAPSGVQTAGTAETTATAEAPAALPRSLAVMPFSSISETSGDDYLADGMSEEILNLLARIPQLRVTGRTSSFAYRERDVDAREIGRQLGVAHLVDGSVRRAGDRLRIVAQLIRAADGYQVWTATYDRTLSDIFAVQEEIAEKVADLLQVTLLGDFDSFVRRTDPGLYESYLRVLQLHRRSAVDEYPAMAEELQRIIREDPDYVPARTLLAAVRFNQASRGQIPYSVAVEEAQAQTETALAIDPNYPLANAARSFSAMAYEHDYARAAAFFRRALELAPGSATILINGATLAYTLGQLDRAAELAELGVGLDPLSVIGYGNLAEIYLHAGRYTDAIGAAERALAISPGNPPATLTIAQAQLLMASPRTALATVREIDAPAARLFVQAIANHDLGRTAEADAALDELIRDHRDRRAMLVAGACAWRGDIDRAFDWLQTAIDEDQFVLGMRTDPMLKRLHDDERWQGILGRLRLADSQVAGIEIRGGAAE